jgi:tetratricopeptide (TPR) repeat protein
MLLAEIHHNLGCVGTETNDPENALKHFLAFKDIALRQHTEATDGSSFSIAIAWNELGNAWMLNKNWQSGEECFLKSIEFAKAKEGFDPTDVSFPMVNLGLAYWMTSRYSEAVKTIEQGLKDREDKFGRDDKESFM